LIRILSCSEATGTGADNHGQGQKSREPAAKGEVSRDELKRLQREDSDRQNAKAQSEKKRPEE
jgi:hypothetical protein